MLSPGYTAVSFHFSWNSLGRILIFANIKHNYKKEIFYGLQETQNKETEKNPPTQDLKHWQLCLQDFILKNN